MTVHVRPLGAGDWTAVAATHAGRAVWSATLPAAAADFEYHVTSDGGLLWPRTAPDLNQTVVVQSNNKG
ncbi:MAG: hypothetical protein U1G05_09260 [Kiritimatiellia bacterium]